MKHGGDQGTGVGWGRPKAERRIDARPNMVSVAEIPAGSPLLYVQEMYHRTGCSLALQVGKEHRCQLLNTRAGARRPYQTGQEAQGKHASHSHLTRPPRNGRYSLEASTVTAQLWPSTRPASRPQRHAKYRALRTTCVPTSFSPCRAHKHGSEGSASGSAGPNAAATRRHLCVDMWVHVLPRSYLTATSDRACV